MLEELTDLHCNAKEMNDFARKVFEHSGKRPIRKITPPSHRNWSRSFDGMAWPVRPSRTGGLRNVVDKSYTAFNRIVSPRDVIAFLGGTAGPGRIDA
jgi:hypothetical protein